jgi:hypothetical protein
VDAAVAEPASRHEGGFIAQVFASSAFVVNLCGVVFTTFAEWMLAKILSAHLGIFLK